MEKAEANIAVSSDSSGARAHACAAQLIPPRSAQMMDEEEVKKELREAKEQLAFTQAALRRRKGQGAQ